MFLNGLFLWCTRHRESLVDLDQPTVPAALKLLDDRAILRQLFDLFPFFIANSPHGFRCAHCFDAAERFTDLIGKSPNNSELQYYIAKAETSKVVIEQGVKNPSSLG